MGFVLVITYLFINSVGHLNLFKILNILKRITEKNDISTFTDIEKKSNIY